MTRDQVRERYAAAAVRVLGTPGGGGAAGCGCGSATTAASSCCGPSAVETEEGFGAALYSAADRSELPGAALEASLGCGKPLVVAELNAGETVLEWVGCIAGALSIGEYTQGLTDAGFVDVEITPTHEVAEGMHSAIIRARKA